MDSDEQHEQKVPLFEQTFSWDDFKTLFNHEENSKNKKQLKSEFKKIGSKAEDENNLQAEEILNFYFNKEGKRIKKQFKKNITGKILESLKNSENDLNEKILKVMVLSDLQRKLQNELNEVESAKRQVLSEM